MTIPPALCHSIAYTVRRGDTLTSIARQFGTTHSAPPQEAKRLYEAYVQALRGLGVARVETGVFAAHMEVSLLNHGPVTILLDTEEWARS